MPQSSLKSSASNGKGKAAREENFFEYMITHHRWVFCVFLLMPLSLAFGTFWRGGREGREGRVFRWKRNRSREKRKSATTTRKA
jgi:hypothetical protein